MMLRWPRALGVLRKEREDRSHPLFLAVGEASEEHLPLHRVDEIALYEGRALAELIPAVSHIHLLHQLTGSADEELPSLEVAPGHRDNNSTGAFSGSVASSTACPT